MLVMVHGKIVHKTFGYVEVLKNKFTLIKIRYISTLYSQEEIIIIIV